jgi:hypothetical protein
MASGSHATESYRLSRYRQWQGAVSASLPHHDEDDVKGELP